MIALTSFVGSLVVVGVAAGLARVAFGRTFRNAVWLFDLSVDLSVPTWYASLSLLLCAALLALIGTHAGRASDDRTQLYWWSLSGIFVLLSIDEVAMIHEWTGNLLHGTSGLFYYSWVVFGMAFVGLVGAMYLPFLLKLPARLRRLMITAGIIFVSGALGAEMVTAWLHDHHPERELIYMLLTALEETLEKVGVLVFLYALFVHLKHLGTRVEIAFSNR